jgi:hypothetical protein
MERGILCCLIAFWRKAREQKELSQGGWFITLNLRKRREQRRDNFLQEKSELGIINRVRRRKESL